MNNVQVVECDQLLNQFTRTSAEGSSEGGLSGASPRNSSALLLRKLLGTVKLEPAQGDIGRPYYRAVSNLEILPLLEENLEDRPPSASAEGGSNSLRWWRRRESFYRTPQIL